MATKTLGDRLRDPQTEQKVLAALADMAKAYGTANPNGFRVCVSLESHGRAGFAWRRVVVDMTPEAQI